MPAAEVSAELLEDVKNYLDITWTDDATDRKTKNFIRSGMAYLNDKLGEAADYTSDGDPRTLLFEYVRYVRDGALDVFENNYMSLILAMQNGRKVKQYAAKEAALSGE